MTVDRPGLKRGELGEAGRIAREETRKVHEFGEAEHFRVVRERQKIADLEPRARGLEVRRRHAARELHAQVHRRSHRAVQEIAQARLPQYVGDLVRIADRRRHAVAQHASVEFERRDERAFDMAMRVDEARNDDLAADVDLPDAAIIADRPDDPVGADRNVAQNEVAADEIEDSPALQHDVRLREPLALLDGAGKKGDGVAHEPVPLGLQREETAVLFQACAAGSSLAVVQLAIAATLIAVAQALHPRADSRRGRRDRRPAPERGRANPFRRQLEQAKCKSALQLSGRSFEADSQATPPRRRRARTAAGRTRECLQRTADKVPRRAEPRHRRKSRSARRSQRRSLRPTGPSDQRC